MKMKRNEMILKCPGYACDSCKVVSTCRRIRAEAKLREVRAEYRKTGKGLNVYVVDDRLAQQVKDQLMGKVI